MHDSRREYLSVGRGMGVERVDGLGFAVFYFGGAEVGFVEEFEDLVDFGAIVEIEGFEGVVVSFVGGERCFASIPHRCRYSQIVADKPPNHIINNH